MRKPKALPTPVTIAALAGLMAALLSLGGCDLLSLFGLFDTENPGPFSISPQTAVLQTDQTVTLKVFGGFGEYTYDYPDLEGAFNEGTGLYTPLGTVSPNPSEYTITIRDELGSEAAATLKVYNAVAPLAVAPTVATLVQGTSGLFTISGGLTPYLFSLDDSDPTQSVPVDAVTVDTSGLALGEHHLEITDAMNTPVLVDITVIAAGTLAIDPVSVNVSSGAAVDFAALNAGLPVFSVDPPGAGFFAAPTANPSTYQAPAVPLNTGTVETVRLSDGAASVTAEVKVFNTSLPLSVFPAYSEILSGETVLLTASGGAGDYTFTLAAGKGTVAQTGPDTALYTAPLTLPTRDQICLTDSVGSLPVYAVVKVSKPK